MSAGDAAVIEAVNELRASIFPSLRRRGVRAIKKWFRSENGADGVVAHKLCFEMRFETLACKRPPRLRRFGGCATFY